ncbi:MAG: flagellar assembly peptidoglycan hydrolase FlgJ, partial [Burkholderiaceae bacterium]
MTISENPAFDTKSLDGLRHAARDNSPESIKAAATQFEALFVNMMLKSMRQAGGQDGMFDSEQSKTYTAMLDQQLSQKIASRGLGLADALVRQMSNNAVSEAVQAESPTTALGG